MHQRGTWLEDSLYYHFWALLLLLMPYGLISAPSVIQAFINKVICEHLNHFVIVLLMIFWCSRHQNKNIQHKPGLSNPHQDTGKAPTHQIGKMFPHPTLKLIRHILDYDREEVDKGRSSNIMAITPEWSRNCRGSCSFPISTSGSNKGSALWQLP